MSIPFEELIKPVGMDNFLTKYRGKRHFVIKSDKPKFNKYYSWEEFDNYLNQINIGGWDRTPQLQIVLPNDGKWCKKKSPQKKSREEIYKLWKSGSSFILTISEFLNETLWKQCQEFEKFYGIGQANIYCSNQKDAKCFPIHADSTDNFLFHVSGKIRWYMYKEFSKDNQHFRPQDATLEEVFELDEGDLLYIPRGKYHRVDTLSPRISISFHFREPPAYSGRKDWYDWKP